MSASRSEATAASDQQTTAVVAASAGADELRAILTRLIETQCRLSGGVAGVVYLAGTSARSPGIFARWPERTNLLDDATLARLERMGEQTLSGEAGRGRIESITISARAGLYEAGQAHLVLVAPLSVGARVEGAAMLLLAPKQELDAERALAQLALSNAPFEAFLWKQQALSESRHKALLRQTLELIDAAQEGDSARGMASIMASELARRFGCTRVSIGLVRASSDRMEIQAISGAEDLDRKGPAADALEDAMEECALQDIELVFPPGDVGDPGAKRVLRAHERLSQTFGPSAILSLPLRVEGDLAGVIVLEREARDPFPAGAVPLLRLVAEFIGPALYTRRLADRGILGVTRDRVRELGSWLVGPRHTLGKLVGLIVLALIVASAVVPIPARVTADAEARAAVNRRIVPPFRAILSEALVRPGERVEEGQLMARLDTQDLELERLRLDAERGELRTQRADAAMRGTPSDAARIDEQIAQRDARIALLDAQIARGLVRSPIAGVVSRGDLDDFVGATVDATQALFEVVTDRLVVVVDVDERDIGRVHVGQRGWLVSKALPDERVGVEVARINPVARAIRGGNVYAVEAIVRPGGADGPPAWLRPGMTGTVRLEAGTTTPMGAFLGPLVDEIRFNLWW